MITLDFLVLGFVSMSFQCESLEKQFESHRAGSLAAGCLVNGNTVDIPTRETVLFTDCFKAIVV